MTILRFIILTLMVAALAASVSTQYPHDPSRDTSASCPKIKVIGVPSVIRAGDTLDFLVDVGESDLNLKYSWILDKGTILEGQGTKSIRVGGTSASSCELLRATVNVEGLSDTCATAYSEVGVIANCGSPRLIDEFGKLEPEDLRLRIDYAIAALQDAPDFDAYFISYGNPVEVSALHNLIQSQLRFRNYPHSRFRLINGGKEDPLRTRVWILPAGTDPELLGIAVVSQPKACPIIRINGPRAVTQPGGVMRFTLDIEEDAKFESIRWKIDNGIILSGQGTSELEVGTPDEITGRTVEAKALVKGLSVNCENQFSETGIVQNYPSCSCYDEFASLPYFDLALRIDTASILLRSSKYSVVFLASYGPKAEVISRHKKIRSHIKFRGLPQENFILMYFGMESKIRTKTSFGVEGISIAADCCVTGKNMFEESSATLISEFGEVDLAKQTEHLSELLKLQKENPGSHAFVVTTGINNYVTHRHGELRNHSNKMGKNKVLFLKGGFSVKLKTKLWLLKQDAGLVD